MDNKDMTHTTSPMMPSTVKSNEATKLQLASAKAEGDAVQKNIAWIISKAGNDGGQIRTGEYKIAYAVTAPEGWYEYSNHATSWRAPIYQ
jgi:hypothetical protein